MKKYIAPIIITVIALVYGLGMTIFLLGAVLNQMVPASAALLAVVGPMAVAILVVVVLVLRIKEIKGGEEDAASKY